MGRRLAGVLAGLALATVATPAGAGAGAGASALHLTARRTGTTVTLTWDAVNGPLLGYAVERSTTDRTFVPARNVLTTHTTFTGLRAGVTYDFVVDAIGRGASTNTIRVIATSNDVSITPVGAPSPPTSVTASARTGAVLVSFRAPRSNGGFPVLAYRAVASPSGRSCRLVSTPTDLGADPTGPLLSCLLTGLRNGVRYRVRVTDTTRDATSRPSPWSNVAIPGQRPSPPGTVVAVPLEQSASVTWRPAFGGGSPITGYVATAEPGGATCATHASRQPAGLTCVISGLTDALTYTVTVVATNALGVSAPSSAVTVVPGPVNTVAIGPFPNGSAVLDGALASSVTDLAQGIVLSGATYVALQGYAADVSDAAGTALATERARAVAAALELALASDGATGVTVAVQTSSGAPSDPADATSVVVTSS